MEFTERYKTRSDKTYVIKLSYNEKIRERDNSEQFVSTVNVLDANNRPVVLPISISKFSTFENFTTFGSYCAINYQGVREAALEGLRTKILTRIEDELEGLG